MHKQEILNLKDKISEKDKEIMNYEKELVRFREQVKELRQEIQSKIKSQAEQNELSNQQKQQLDSLKLIAENGSSERFEQIQAQINRVFSMLINKNDWTFNQNFDFGSVRTLLNEDLLEELRSL